MIDIEELQRRYERLQRYRREYKERTKIRINCPKCNKALFNHSLSKHMKSFHS